MVVANCKPMVQPEVCTCFNSSFSILNRGPGIQEIMRVILVRSSHNVTSVEVLSMQYITAHDVISHITRNRLGDETMCECMLKWVVFITWHG